MNLNEVKDAAIERLKSPLAGSYVLFLSAWNWKAIVFMFGGDLSPGERIEKITELYTGDVGSYASALGWPLGITVLYCFSMPWIREFYARWTISREAMEESRRLEARRNIADAERHGESLPFVIGQVLKVSDGWGAKLNALSNSIRQSDMMKEHSKHPMARSVRTDEEREFFCRDILAVLDAIVLEVPVTRAKYAPYFAAPSQLHELFVSIRKAYAAKVKLFGSSALAALPESDPKE